MKITITAGIAFALAMQGSVLAATGPTLPVQASPSPSAPIALPTARVVTILVPAGTLVPVHLVGVLSSGSARVDETFQIQVAQDVIVDGMIAIRQGSGGQGHIIDSKGASGSGRSGSISLTFDYVFSADGGRVRLSQAAQTQTEEDRKGASSPATIVGIATFGIGGLFGHNLAHGRQKTIDSKTVISAFVSDNVHVDTTERGAVVRYNH